MPLPRPPRPTALTALLLAALPLACAGQGQEAEKVPPAPVTATSPHAIVFGQWTSLSGTTQPLPQHAARISAAIEGQVLYVLADDQGKPLPGPDGQPVDTPAQEGRPVKAGQVIVQLNDKMARATYDKLKAGQQDLEEQVKQAEYNVQLAQTEYNRLQGLLKGRSTANGDLPLVAPVEVEKAGVALQNAQSQQRGAVARREGAAKDLAVQEVQLNLYALKAPIAGRLGLLQVGPGQTISVGTTVADIVDLDEIDVLCYVPPSDAGLIAAEQQARLMVEDGTGKLTPSGPTGKVVFVAETAQADSGNFPVKLRFPNKDHRLRANAVVRAQVLTQPRVQRVSIEDAALLEDEQPPLVVVVEDLKDSENDEHKPITVGKAHRLQAKVGVRDQESGDAEVLSLTDPANKKEVPDIMGALFVIKGAHGLRDGDDVVVHKPGEDED